VKIAVTLSSRDFERFADLIERRTRERIAARTPAPRNDDDRPSPPPRRDRRS
jgi:hypothetical protein